MKKRRQKHPEKERERKRKYWTANAEKIAARRREKHAANPDIKRKQKLRYRAKLKKLIELQTFGVEMT